jgi:site-specific DNA-methyltransferase (adenine-specific)
MEREALTPLGEFYCLRSACVAQRNFQGVTDRGELTDLWWDIHRLKHNTRRVDHPCQLPPGLMRRLIALFTNEGELILDPFNGAGTSTLVAEQLNRRYFGIEISKTYHDLALRRHRQLRGGFDPFAKTNRVPGAKNSPVKRLQKQKYAVSKKMLQLEVRRIARTLGHMPTRSDVEQLSRFPMEYYRSYFISWGEVCAAARTTGMSENRPGMKHSDHSRQRGLFAEE